MPFGDIHGTALAVAGNEGGPEMTRFRGTDINIIYCGEYGRHHGGA